MWWATQMAQCIKWFLYEHENMTLISTSLKMARNSGINLCLQHWGRWKTWDPWDTLVNLLAQGSRRLTVSNNKVKSNQRRYAKLTSGLASAFLNFQGRSRAHARVWAHTQAHIQWWHIGWGRKMYAAEIYEEIYLPKQKNILTDFVKYYFDRNFSQLVSYYQRIFSVVFIIIKQCSQMSRYWPLTS